MERARHTLAVMLALLHGSVEALVHLSRTQKDRCKLVFWEPKFRQYMKDIFETPGMLLEGLDNSELVALIDDNAALQAKIQEALAALEAHAAQQGGQ